MARIQPSFLHFYLFRTRHHNASFLLTSKYELKYPRGSFLNNPNFYPFDQQHFPLKNNSKPSPQIFRYRQRDCQDFAHIPNSLISNPLFQISNTIPGQFTKTQAWTLPVPQIFSTPLWGKTFTKPGMASTSTENIDSILGRLHKTLSICTTLPNIEPVAKP